MKVRCMAELPTEEQANQLGWPYYRPGEMEYGLTVGEEYIVFGLRLIGGQPWIDIEDDSERFTRPVPLCLFEIIDGRTSQYWEVRSSGKGDLKLWPPSFYIDYYHDLLSNGEPELVEDYKRVRALIIAETEESN